MSYLRVPSLPFLLTMTTDSESIAAALRDLHRRHQSLATEETGEQQFARFAELQAASFRLLQSSPEGWQHFLRRNYAARRAEVIDGRWQPLSPDRPADGA